MAKYDELNRAMGSTCFYNDKTTTGRVLKWYSRKFSQTPAQRAAEAKRVAKKLLHLPYVQRVEVKNATIRSGGPAVPDRDKICVFIDAI